MSTNMHLHDTKSVYTKLLQVNHELKDQSAVAGAGRGTYAIQSGPGLIHPVLLEMLKLDIVFHVACGNGYIMISVSEPRRWGEIEGQLHHIAARNLPKE